jgi:processive 1,2-diacylglycerol beta-glucosyltransferase
MAGTQNVLILTSNTGGGHRSAAQALEDSLIRLNPGRVLVKIAQVLEDATVVSRKAAELYNYLLREHQDWMKYYYWAVNKIRPNESKLIFKAALGYGGQLFDRYCPNIIVSVHPMTQHFFAYVLRKLRLIDRVPLVTVVTDPCYGFWRGWACEDVKRYYVATSDAKQQLLDYGVASHKIQIVGMPVHSRFQPVAPEQRPHIRQELGLSPEKFTVFVNAGWVGGGNIPKIFSELAEADLDIQAVFLAGRNERLLREGHQLAEAAQFPIHVMSYTDEIHKVMNASDVMISKLGGLTTFEAMASHLPVIGDAITPPMPQEAQTAELIRRAGAGLLLDKPGDIVPLLQSLTQEPSRYETLLHATRQIGRPGATDRIAENIMAQLPWQDLETELRMGQLVR